MTPRESTARTADEWAPTSALQRAPSPRPSLVAPAAKPLPGRVRWRPRPVAVAVGVVIASLLFVVGGNMELASGQLRLEQADSILAQLQSTYAARLALVAQDTSPQQLALGSELRASPREVLPIPAVSLRYRLPAVRLSSAPCCSLTPGR